MPLFPGPFSVPERRAKWLPFPASEVSELGKGIGG